RARSAGSPKEFLGQSWFGCPSAAAAPDGTAQGTVARKARPGRGDRMRTSIVAGDDLDIFMAPPAVAIFVLDASVGKVHLLCIVRKATPPRPEANFVRQPIGAAIAVLPSAVVLLQEPLMVAFELIIEHHTFDLPTLRSQPLIKSDVRLIELSIVRQLTRFSE